MITLYMMIVGYLCGMVSAWALSEGYLLWAFLAGCLPVFIVIKAAE